LAMKLEKKPIIPMNLCNSRTSIGKGRKKSIIPQTTLPLGVWGSELVSEFENEIADFLLEKKSHFDEFSAKPCFLRAVRTDAKFLSCL